MTNLILAVQEKLGDMKGQRFAPSSIRAAIIRALNKVNMSHRINQAQTWVSIKEGQTVFRAPSDCFLVSSITSLGIELPLKPKGLSDFKAGRTCSVLYTAGPDLELYPFDKDASYSYRYYDAPAVIDFNKAKRVIVEGGTYVVYFGALDSTNVSEGEAKGFQLSLEYIKDYNLMAHNAIDIPAVYREALALAAASDLLSNDDRDEVVRKASSFLNRYEYLMSKIKHEAVARFKTYTRKTAYRGL